MYLKNIYIWVWLSPRWRLKPPWKSKHSIFRGGGISPHSPLPWKRLGILSLNYYYKVHLLFTSVIILNPRKPKKATQITIKTNKTNWAWFFLKPEFFPTMIRAMIVHDCMRKIHDCMRKIHNCIRKIHDFMRKIHDCMRKIYDCIKKIHDCMRKIHDCIKKIHDCMRKIHDCMMKMNKFLGKKY